MGAQQFLDAVDLAARPGRGHQRGLMFESVQHTARVLASAQLRGERGGQGVTDAGYAQEVLQVGGQPAEDLTDQVVGHRAVITGELGEERVVVARLRHAARGQPHPAAHPPVRRCRTSTCRGDSRSPVLSSSAAVCSGVKDNCAARSSHSRPVSRSRGSASGGSSRLASTSCTVAGLTRMKARRLSSACGSTRLCTSSRISRMGCGDSANPAANCAMNSDWVAGRHTLGVQPAGTRHGRAAGHRGHHRRPQPPQG